MQLARAVTQLLDTGASRFQKPSARFARRLESIITAGHGPVESSVKKFYAVLTGSSDPTKLRSALTTHGYSLVDRHRNLRYVGKFPMPAEVETAYSAALEAIGLEHPENAYYSATSDVGVIEEAPPGVGLDTSVLSLPAALTLLPLYWPLLSHELGHRWLRERVPGESTRLGTQVARPRSYGSEDRTRMVGYWRHEAAADRAGVQLFGPAFLAAFLHFSSVFLGRQLSTFTSTHPAPTVRMLQMMRRLPTIYPLRDKLQRRLDALAPSGKLKATMPVTCRSCRKALDQVVLQEVGDYDNELEEAISIFERRFGWPASPPSINSARVVGLAERLRARLPLDLSFAPEPERTSVNEKLESVDTVEGFESLLDGLRPAPPPVTELFCSAWSHRYMVEEQLEERLRNFSGSMEHLKAITGDSLRELQFASDNLVAALRSYAVVARLRLPERASGEKDGTQRQGDSEEGLRSD